MEEYADGAKGTTKVFAVTEAQWRHLPGGWRFRKADDSDKGAVRALYASVTGSEFCTWNEAYPTDEDIDTDLAGGNLYVLADGTGIVGALSVVSENELDGLPFWHETGGAREIARVAVSPSFQGRGMAGILVGEIEKILSEAGCKAIHLLAAVQNTPACRLYHRAGFALRGRCDMYGSTFYAFEKSIKG